MKKDEGKIIFLQQFLILKMIVRIQRNYNNLKKILRRLIVIEYAGVNRK